MRLLASDERCLGEAGSADKNEASFLKTLTWDRPSGIACLGPRPCSPTKPVTNTLGPDSTANIDLTTGYNTLPLLILSVAISPLRKLVPKLTWLIKFRRLLGLFACFYGTVAMPTYVALYAGFDLQTMLDDIAKRKFITIGVARWLLLLPFAVKTGVLSPLRLTIVLAVLFLAKPIRALGQQRRKGRPVAA
jgi:DMSO/TMAO reductase YedYZ heme-binding membrane subunit